MKIIKRLYRISIAIAILYVNYMFNYSVISHLYRQHVVYRVDSYEYDIIFMVFINASYNCIAWVFHC